MSAAKPKEVYRQLGFESPGDLILHLPLRYEDETSITPIAHLTPGQMTQVEGRIVRHEIQRGARNQLLFEVNDGSTLPLRIRLLHFHPGQATQLTLGTLVRAYGEARSGLLGFEMVHPRYRVLPHHTPLPVTLTPVYPTVAGVSQYRLRQAIEAALQSTDLSETLSDDLIRRLDLPDFAATVRFLHTPPAHADRNLIESRQGPAWRRLKFDELLAQQLSLRLAERHTASLSAMALHDSERMAQQLETTLGFALTASQIRCVKEIGIDLACSRPMHRLLHGDVGSGKTCVAAIAAAQAVGSGAQVAVMAPTELLAEQLYAKFSAWFSAIGQPVVWLTSAIKGRARQATLTALADGTVPIAVGTHALFQNEVHFKNLALVIVDEQHRFGVEQRLALRQKGVDKNTPHLLMMSATPIPRSLAMTYYADLKVSSIDERPPGRTSIDTRVLSDARRAEIITRLQGFCGDGGQAYWVCPLIEESEKLDLKAALDTHAELCTALPDLRIGLAHGRLKSAEKAAVMAAFKAGDLHILVATTVIEVGVDVPNASLMVIEHAERMGLAQLHQLRGRVGRGSRTSSCILLYSLPLGVIARERLAIIRDSQDGFEIARHDLRLRGPGEFVGARQSGAEMLRFADLDADIDLIEAARDAAQLLLDSDSPLITKHLQRWLPRGQALYHA